MRVTSYGCHFSQCLAGWKGAFQLFVILNGRPVARGSHIPKICRKGPLLATIWAKNRGFIERVKGVRFKKSLYFDPLKGLLLVDPLKSILAMGLVHGLQSLVVNGIPVTKVVTLLYNSCPEITHRQARSSSFR